MNRLILLLACALTSLLATSASAQVYISPPSGNLSPGGWIHVDNWTPDAVWVEIKLDDGTVVVSEEIEGMRKRDYKVPNIPELIGRRVQVQVKHQEGVTRASYEISLPGDGHLEPGGATWTSFGGTSPLAAGGAAAAIRGRGALQVT